MKNNTNTVLAVGLLGFGVYYFTKSQNSNNNNQNATYPNYPTIPQAPPGNTGAWQSWVIAILSTIPLVLSLWQPGGPFYNDSDPDDTFGFVDPNDWGYDIFGP